MQKLEPMKIWHDNKAEVVFSRISSGRNCFVCPPKLLNMHGRLCNDEVIANPDCFDYLDTKYVCLLHWALSVFKMSGIVVLVFWNSLKFQKNITLNCKVRTFIFPVLECCTNRWCHYLQGSKVSEQGSNGSSFFWTSSFDAKTNFWVQL